MPTLEIPIEEALMKLMQEANKMINLSTAREEDNPARFTEIHSITDKTRNALEEKLSEILKRTQPNLAPHFSLGQSELTPEIVKEIHEYYTQQNESGNPTGGMCLEFSALMMHKLLSSPPEGVKSASAIGYHFGNEGKAHMILKINTEDGRIIYADPTRQKLYQNESELAVMLEGRRNPAIQTYYRTIAEERAIEMQQGYYDPNNLKLVICEKSKPIDVKHPTENPFLGSEDESEGYVEGIPLPEDYPSFDELPDIEREYESNQSEDESEGYIEGNPLPEDYLSFDELPDIKGISPDKERKYESNQSEDESEGYIEGNPLPEDYPSFEEIQELDIQELDLQELDLTNQQFKTEPEFKKKLQETLGQPQSDEQNDYSNGDKSPNSSSK